jgi:predicted RNA-binding Zn-ribbon protein involved in translation (DUF1610 family)
MREGRLPPQRRPGGGPGGGGRGGRNMSPKEGAAEAEARLGLPCYHAGQRVVGRFGCVACQFQINNRGTLPTCPECGEIVWAFMGEGPRPVPQGESPDAVPAAPAAPAATVEEGVKLDAPAPVSVEENVKLEP